MAECLTNFPLGTLALIFILMKKCLLPCFLAAVINRVKNCNKNYLIDTLHKQLF